MEEIHPGLYRIEVPLEGNPLGSVNAYLVRGDDRWLLVDTAFNAEACRDVLDDALNCLKVDRDRLDIFATHLHADHTGLMPYLAGKNSTLYLNDYGVTVLTTDDWEPAVQYARRNGFPSEELDTLFEMHPGKKFSGSEIPDLTSLTEGSRLTVGDYELEIIDTPGHTLGHQCLYEPDRGILFSGDHVLGDITPNVSVHTEKTRYLLVHYLESLEKVRKRDVEIVCPGHRSPFEDLDKRIAELRDHHAIRAAEILEILDEADEPLNGYDLAIRMDWDIPLADWDSFPVVQRWFATGEALSHIWYLENEGKVSVTQTDNQTLFTSSE
jgi:glyoxylase-like metal-dependent hydrolase (beta-lactamase superfamily II)